MQVEGFNTIYQTIRRVGIYHILKLDIGNLDLLSTGLELIITSVGFGWTFKVRDSDRRTRIHTTKFQKLESTGFFTSTSPRRFSNYKNIFLTRH